MRTPEYVEYVRGMYAWKQLDVVGEALTLSGCQRLNAGWWTHERSGMTVRTAYGCGEAELHIEDHIFVYVHHRSDHLLSYLLTRDTEPKLIIFSMNLRKVLDTLCGTP